MFDVRVHAKVDGTNWTDISSAVQYENKIRIREGAGNQGGRIDSGSCEFRLRNDDGDYTPGNPVSTLYPDWGLGTPVRVGVYEGDVALVLEENNAFASTPDNAALDITGDIDIRIDMALWNMSHSHTPQSTLGTELIGKLNGVPNKSWLLSLEEGHLRLEWSTDGSNTVDETSTVPLRQPGSNPRMAVRATLDVNNGLGGYTVTFYRADTIDSGSWEVLGEPIVTTSGTTSIFSGSSILAIGNATVFNFLPFPYGSVFKAEVRNGIDGTVVANPDFTAQAPGTTSFADSAGRTWSTGGTAEITDRKTRFSGEIASLSPGRTQKNFRFVDVEVGGVMRRLGANDEKLKSAVYRDVTSSTRSNIIGYWPLEDGTEATEFSSPLDGVSPAAMSESGVDPSAYSLWGASSPIPTFSSGYVMAPMPSYTPTTELSTRFFVAVPSGGVALTRTLLTLYATGTGRYWILDLSTSGGLQVRVQDQTGTNVYSSGFSAFALNGVQRMLTLEMTQNGANVDYRLVSSTVTKPLNLSTISGTVPSVTFDRVKTVRLNDGGDFGGGAIGQLTVADDLDAYSGASDSIANWVTETSVDRVSRLCDEEGIPVDVAGVSTSPMGGQGESDLLTLLRDVAAAEQAMLGETRYRVGLFYRAPDSLASQQEVMTLPYTSTAVVEPFQPVYDDTYLVNDFTASRRDGGFTRHRETEGRRSVSDPPTGVGPYEGSDTFNVAYEWQTADLASWSTHIGTFDGARFSGLRVRLDKDTSLVDEFCRAYIGDVFKMSDVPLDLAGTSDIKLRVEGYREEIDQFEWVIDYVMTPGEPWDIAFAGGDDTAFSESEFAWADTEGSELAEALTSTETDMDVLTTSGVVWTSDPFDSPYDLRMGGEIVTVQAPGAFASANPFFSTDTTSWSGSGASISRSTVVVNPHPRATASLVVTPDGVSAAALARTDLSAVGAVVAGQRYTISTWVRVTTTTADIRPYVQWFDAAGVSISDSGSAQSATAGEWTHLQETVTAPANASRYRLAVRLGGTPSSSAAFYAWAPRMTLVKASAIYDEFGRTATDTWAAADTGQSWTNTGGAAADYDVLSGYGRHTHPAAATGHHSVIAAPHASFDVYCDFTVAATSTGASQFAGILARYVDVDNLYEARVDFTTTGSVNLTIRERAGGVEAALGTATAATTYVAGTFLRCRFQGYGTALKAKVWALTEDEPHAWDVSVTDGTLTAAGSVGVKTMRNTGNTNASADIRADNFNLITPQTFTVIRSVNDVVKTQTSGEDVRLAFPAIAGI